MSKGSLPIQRIYELARDEKFVATIARLYDSLDRRIQARSPTCTNRGLCCNFKSYDHRLYVTPIELAYFIAETPFPYDDNAPDGACPYQRDGLCTARTGRPCGCRVFFCQLGTEEWQSDETEATLTEIKALHRRFDVPYQYVEWLTALEELRNPRDRTDTAHPSPVR